jgi:hypothetical protein
MSRKFKTSAPHRSPLDLKVDDVVIFVKLAVHDLIVRELLAFFGAASGLIVNSRKTSATLITLRERDDDLVQQLLRCNFTHFPIKYLGLQLALRPLTCAQWLSLLDATVKIVPAWQRGLIARPGRLVMIKAVMVARPIHNLLIDKAPC